MLLVLWTDVFSLVSKLVNSLNNILVARTNIKNKTGNYTVMSTKQKVSSAATHRLISSIFVCAAEN